MGACLTKKPGQQHGNPTANFVDRLGVIKADDKNQDNCAFNLDKNPIKLTDVRLDIFLEEGSEISQSLPLK